VTYYKGRIMVESQNVKFGTKFCKVLILSRFAGVVQW